MIKPKIVLNFKNYKESIGDNCFQLAKIAETVSTEYNFPVVVCPVVPYLKSIVESIDIPVFSQHVDIATSNSNTGENYLEILLKTGVQGVLVNHPENELTVSNIEFVIRMARTMKLYTLVFSSNEAISAALTKLDPHAIAFSPPDLLPEDKNLSNSRPELIEDYVRRIKLENSRVSPFCAAGISSVNDVRLAFEHGAEGIVISSLFVKAKDPKQNLEEIIKSIQKVESRR